MKKILAGDYPITQYFGQTLSDYSEYGMIGHNGVDFGTNIGVDCISPIDGKASVGFDPQGYGYYVKIIGSDRSFIFAHLSAIGVANDETIVVNKVVGKTGNSGNSTGPHCHVGLRPIPYDDSNGYHGYIDPLPFLNDTPVPQDDLANCQLRVRELEDDGGRKQAIIEARDEEIIKLKASTLDLTTQVKTLQDGLQACDVELRSERDNKVAQVHDLEIQIKRLEADTFDLTKEINTVDKINVELQNKIDTWWDGFTKWQILSKFFEKLKADWRR